MWAFNVPLEGAQEDGMELGSILLGVWPVIMYTVHSPGPTGVFLVPHAVEIGERYCSVPEPMTSYCRSCT